jgi:hypothetical protein
VSPWQPYGPFSNSARPGYEEPAPTGRKVRPDKLGRTTLSRREQRVVELNV